MRELTLSMAHMLRIELEGFENDASACYDRILMNMMGAASERMGVPEGPLWLQEDVLLNVIHYLKTGFGITINSYTSDNNFRFHGVGQGSKAGPISWAWMSSNIFHAQELWGHGVKFACPERQIHHARHSNARLCWQHNGICLQPTSMATPPPGKQELLFDGLLRDSQIWEWLLWSSGGLLKIEKCWFYAIQWTFEANGKAKMWTVTDMALPPFKLTEGKSNACITVPQLIAMTPSVPWGYTRQFQATRLNR
jgi:hypothetical protein